MLSDNVTNDPVLPGRVSHVIIPELMYCPITSIDPNRNFNTSIDLTSFKNNVTIIPPAADSNIGLNDNKSASLYYLNLVAGVYAALLNPLRLRLIFTTPTRKHS